MHQYPIILLVLLLVSCSSSSEEETNLACGDSAIVDTDLYESDSQVLLTIVSAEIVEDCMNITYAASGCSPDDWQPSLIASESIAESLPEQRYMKLTLPDPEACLAIFTEEVSIDISTLQIENDGELILNIDGYEEAIRYSY